LEETLEADISILPKTGHFYFALTHKRLPQLAAFAGVVLKLPSRGNNFFRRGDVVRPFVEKAFLVVIPSTARILLFVRLQENRGFLVASGSTE